MNSIIVKEANSRFFTNLSLEIPKSKITLLYGNAKSGKEHLCRDIICLSSQIKIEKVKKLYNNTFIDQLKKPCVKEISNLPPFIRLATNLEKSNVNIFSYLKLDKYFFELYLKKQNRICPNCSNKIRLFNISDAIKDLLEKILSEKTSPDEILSISVEVKKNKIKDFNKLGYNELINEIPHSNYSLVVIDKIYSKQINVERLRETFNLLRSFVNAKIVVFLDKKELSNYNINNTCSNCFFKFDNKPSFMLEDLTSNSFDFGIDFKLIKDSNIKNLISYTTKDRRITEISQFLISLELGDLKYSSLVKNLKIKDIILLNLLKLYLSKINNNLLYLPLNFKYDWEKLDYFLNALKNRNNTIVITSSNKEVKAHVDYLINLSSEKTIKTVDYHDFNSSLNKTKTIIEYLNCSKQIYQFFANTPQAKIKGLKANDFALTSTKGKRCNQCKGTGLNKHLSKTYPLSWLRMCQKCNGSSYSQEIQEYVWKENTIKDILSYKFSEVDFLNHIKGFKITKSIMEENELGYLKLGTRLHELEFDERNILENVKKLIKQIQ